MPPSERRIGIFGGSFDPVHNAHLAFARLALRQLSLDELRWVPAGRPWQKSRVITPGADREAMLRLAIAGEPRFVLSRVELERDGPSYTADTVQALRSAEPGARWYVLLGQDQYAAFHTWHRWQDILSQVTLVSADRPGAVFAADPRVVLAPHVSIELPPMDLSSTAVRDRLAAGRSIDDLVPAPVARYIESHGLYGHLPHPHRAARPPGAEWTFASCNASSSTVWKTSRPRTSSCSTPSTCHRCSSA